MNDSMISKAIKRSNLNLVLICLAGVFLVVMLAAANMRYITNFVLGPFEVTPEALAGVQDASKLPQYWVRVTGYDIYDLDIQYVETSDSGKETVEFSYLALELGEKLLMVKQPGLPKMETTLTGSLQTLTAEEQAEIIDYYVKDDPSLEGVFLPYLLHTGSFRTSGWIVFILGLAAAAACLFGLFLYVQRSADPAAHPVMKSLARFGPADFIIPQLENELAMEHTVASRKFHLTRNWLIYATASQFQATRFEDIVWSYLHVHTTRTYGIAVAKV